MSTFNSYVDPRRIVNNGVIQGADHTSLVLNHKLRQKYVNEATTTLRKILDDFDSIVCCGISGLIVVPQIAEVLDKNILIVRKPPNERMREYSTFILEGAPPKRYVIVDDLVCSGNTIRYIMKQIKLEIPSAKCMGMYAYMKESCSYRVAAQNFKKRFGVEYLNEN